MSNEQEAARAALMRFYDAIEQLVTVGDIQAMHDAWHHNDDVTGGHPSGSWAHGWEELAATWEVFAGFAGPDRGNSKVDDLRVTVSGDVAYSTCLFTTPPMLGAEQLCCSNVLRKIDGEWKLVHHHADKAPKLASVLEQIARGEL